MHDGGFTPAVGEPDQRLPVEGADAACGDDLALLLQAAALVALVQQLQEGSDGEEHAGRVDGIRVSELGWTPGQQSRRDVRDGRLCWERAEGWSVDAGVGEQHVDVPVSFANLLRCRQQGFFGGDIAYNRDDSTTGLACESVPNSWRHMATLTPVCGDVPPSLLRHGEPRAAVQ